VWFPGNFKLGHPVEINDFSNGGCDCFSVGVSYEDVCGSVFGFILG